MKKLLSYLTAICLSCTILTACGGPSWDPERAQELDSKEFESLTPQDFDEMLDLMEGYCFNSDIPKSGSEEWDKLTEEQRDEYRASLRMFTNMRCSSKCASPVRSGDSSADPASTDTCSATMAVALS